MSALGVKRSFDIFAHDHAQNIRSTACSPHRIQFLNQEQQRQTVPLPPFHPTFTSTSASTSTSSSSSATLTFDPHNNSGSIGSKRFRRTDSGDYDIVTVAGDDVYMETKSPTHDDSSPSSSPTSTPRYQRSSSREPSAFVQAASAAASSTEPFVNLDGLLQQHYQSTTRVKRQRSRDQESRDDQDMPTSPVAKKVATSTSMPTLHTDQHLTSTPTPSTSSTSSIPTSSSSNPSPSTPGVTSLAVFSTTRTTSSSTSSSSSSSSSSARAAPLPSPSQRLFTLTDVRKIVEEALAQQKEQLTQEYDQILNEKLREQFENFSSFNRDYISRQLSKNDFSYLS